MMGTKKIFLLLLFIVTINQEGIGQKNNMIDSLKSLINESYNDTLKINLLNQIAYAYKDTNRTMSLHYSNLSQELAIKNNFSKGLVDSYINKGNYFQNSGQPDSALHYFKKSEFMAKNVGYESGAAKALGSMGNILLHRGNLHQGLEYLDEASEVFQSVADSSNEAQVLIVMGATYKELGNYYKSILCFSRAVDLTEQLIDKKSLDRQIIALNNMGAVILELESPPDYKLSMKYLQRALTLSTEQNNQRRKLESLFNIGANYVEQKFYNEGLKSYSQALLIINNIGNIKDSILYYNYLGSLYKDSAAYTHAINYFEICLRLARQSGDVWLEVKELSNIGSSLISLSEFQKAIGYLNEAFQLAKIHEFFDIQRDYWQLMNQYYEKQNKISEAYNAFKSFAECKDSINIKYKEISRLVYDLETKKQQRKTNREKAEMKMVHEKEIAKQILRRNIFISTTIVLSVWIIIFMLSNSRLMQNATWYSIFGNEGNTIITTAVIYSLLFIIGQIFFYFTSYDDKWATGIYNYLGFILPLFISWFVHRYRSNK